MDPGPVGAKWARPCPVGSWLLPLAGEQPCLILLAGGADAYA